MSTHWLVIGVLSYSAILLVSGCAPPPENLQAYPAAHDLFMTLPRVIVDSTPPAIVVTNQLSGTVTVYTGHTPEVAGEVVATITDFSLAEALEKERQCIKINNTGAEVSVAPAPGVPREECGALHDQLHVHVPPDVKLLKINALAGNINVFGNVTDVAAMITTSGNIEIFGARGAELAPETERIVAQTPTGDISLFAMNAWVTAATGEGNLKFMGSLRANQNNSLTITGTGNLDLALPAYVTQTRHTQPYQVFATTRGNPIITDFPPTTDTSTNLTICGFVRNNGPVDYHIENAPQLSFGRIEVSPAITSSAFFSGTLADSYYLFETDQPQITFWLTRPHSVHVYTSDQKDAFLRGDESIDAGCEAALHAPAPPIHLDLKTGRGRIYIRHIYQAQ